MTATLPLPEEEARSGEALGAAYRALAANLAPLKPSEHALLAQLLAAAGLPPERIDTVTGLHGYLTALAIGPQDIEPEEWLAHLWEGATPAVHGEQLTRLLTAIARMRIGIEADFQRPQPKLPIPGLQPAAAPDMTPIERRGYLMLWCGGFMHAVQLRARRWQPLLGEHDPLGLVWRLGTQEGLQQHRLEIIEAYEQDGYEEEDALAMTARFYHLPSSYRNTLAGLRQDLRAISDHFDNG